MEEKEYDEYTYTEILELAFKELLVETIGYYLKDNFNSFMKCKKHFAAELDILEMIEERNRGELN